MVTGHVFIATSLDGFIARPDGRLDWLIDTPKGPKKPEGEDFGYGAFLAAMDGLVMGRGTFEAVRDFDPWPYEKPVVVLSAALRDADIPDRLRGRLSLDRGTPAEVMGRLAGKGWRRAYVDGGATIRQFLAAGQIAEIVVSRLPVLIGAGLPLFGPEGQDRWLTHAETRSYPGGLVQSRYLVERPTT
jgi:dihydrofolate reductase